MRILLSFDIEKKKTEKRFNRRHDAVHPDDEIDLNENEIDYKLSIC